MVDLDGWMALPAFVPPKERRGLVLIDPPYEQKDEFERLAEGFAEAFAKWPTGSYLLWYPVKSRRATDNLARHVAQAAGAGTPPGKTPASGVQRRASGRRGGLTSAGLLIVNPPWTLVGDSRRSCPNWKSRSARAAPAASGSRRRNLRHPAPRVSADRTFAAGKLGHPGGPGD